MSERKADSTVGASDEKIREKLRQEQETFDQHKLHENRWFVLRLVMGYTAGLLLFSVIAICVYVFLNHASLPRSIVISASAAFFGDVVGLLIAVWKIVFNPDFMTKLAPVTQDAPVFAGLGSTPDEPLKDKVKKKITVLSAKYGKGEKTNDVTEIVRAIVAAAEVESVHFTVNNKTLAVGDDPFKGKGKELTIVYSYDGKTHTITVPEHEECSLPPK